jgi:hypothetical protein
MREVDVLGDERRIVRQFLREHAIGVGHPLPDDLVGDRRVRVVFDGVRQRLTSF